MKASTFPPSLEEAFNFDTPIPEDLEVESIKDAVRSGEHYISSHAQGASIDDDISIEELEGIILRGEAKSKDLPYNHQDRKPGINFEGNIKVHNGKVANNQKVRVKVSWLKGRDGIGRYTIATVHKI